MRLCVAFVDNLTLILRLAFIAGAFFLASDLRTLPEELNPPVVEVAPVQTNPVNRSAPTPAIEEDPGWLTSGVKQALNCTYENFRSEHYDECVKEASSIYTRPQADPDDTGYIMYETRTLFARLDN